jgi:hypothetical protein
MAAAAPFWSLSDLGSLGRSCLFVAPSALMVSQTQLGGFIKSDRCPPAIHLCNPGTSRFGPPQRMRWPMLERGPRDQGNVQFQGDT